jgi:hypothetical protein
VVDGKLLLFAAFSFNRSKNRFPGGDSIGTVVNTHDTILGAFKAAADFQSRMRASGVKSYVPTKIVTILNIMNLVGIQSQPQLVIKGLVILVAVFFSSGNGPRRLVRSLASFGRKKA